MRQQQFSNLGDTMKRSLFLKRCLFVFGVLTSFAYPARADFRLFVDSGAAPGGDGSAGAPCQRITDAIARARAVSNPDESTLISVAPGTYLAGSGGTEASPIIIDF